MVSTMVVLQKYPKIFCVPPVLKDEFATVDVNSMHQNVWRLKTAVTMRPTPLQGDSPVNRRS
jgi:hypothetical protein